MTCALCGEPIHGPAFDGFYRHADWDRLWCDGLDRAPADVSGWARPASMSVDEFAASLPEGVADRLGSRLKVVTWAI